MRSQRRLAILVLACCAPALVGACGDAQRRALCQALPGCGGHADPPVTPTVAPVPLPNCTRTIGPGESVSRVEADLTAGDVLCLRGGVYSQKVTLTTGGSSNAPIFVRAAKGEIPVIDGTSAGIAHNDGLFNILAGANFIVVDGLTIQHSGSRGLVNDGSNVTVQRTKILDNADAGIMTTNWSGPATNDVYIDNEIAFNVASNDCKTVSDPCSNNGGWESATNHYSGGSSLYGPVIFRGNTIHDNDGEGMVLGDGDQVIGNVIHDNFGCGIYLDGTQGAVVDSNLLYERETSYLPYTSNQSYRLLGRGIGLADESAPARNADNTIRNNFILNAREGIQFWNTGVPGSGLHNDTIDNNTIVNTWEPGIDIQSGRHSGTVVRDNIVVPRSGDPTEGLPASGIMLAANLFTNIGASNDPHLPGEGTFNFDPRDEIQGPASDAVDRGVPSSATRDYWGTRRPSRAAWDIGATESK